MKKKLLLGLLCGLCLTANIYAAESVIKEETTPPPAEGAITLDQLPPVVSTQTN